MEKEGGVISIWSVKVGNSEVSVIDGSANDYTSSFGVSKMVVL